MRKLAVVESCSATLLLIIIVIAALSSTTRGQEPCGGVDNPCGAIHRWMEYGNIRNGDERAVLDALAKGLRDSPDSIAYFLFYAGQTPCKDEAAKRGIRAKNYLIRKHAIPPDRIVWRDGGLMVDLSTQIWVVPRGSKLPEPQTTVVLTNVRATKKCKLGSL